MATPRDQSLIDFSDRYGMTDYSVDLQTDENDLRQEYTKDQVLEFAALAPEALAAEMAKLLRWFVQTDDTSLGMEGNDFWVAGNYRARALVRAFFIQQGGDVATAVAPDPNTQADG